MWTNPSTFGFDNRNGMAEYLRRQIGNHSLLALWLITESTEELEAAISLRAEEKKLYESFVAESRRKQWLAYRLLIRDLLRPDDFPVEYDETNKPYLAGSNYHISVSHSGDMAAVIISRKSRVGIDIEKIRPRVGKVKERFLSLPELDRIGNDSGFSRLTLAWSAKEAIYKLFGQRDLDFRENICLHLPDQPGEPFDGDIILDSGITRFRIENELIGDYILVYVEEPAP